MIVSDLPFLNMWGFRAVVFRQSRGVKESNELSLALNVEREGSQHLQLYSVAWLWKAEHNIICRCSSYMKGTVLKFLSGYLETNLDTN